MAINEEPQSAYYTSRLGIRSTEIIEYYKQKLARKKKVKLKMLHFLWIPASRIPFITGVNSERP